MSATIDSIAVEQERFNSLWGVTPCDYTLSGKSVDLQDLMVKITQQRASAIEAEVSPLQSIITKRNDRLEKESVVLQKLTEAQANYDDDTSTQQITLTDSTGKISSVDEFVSILESYGWTGSVSSGNKITLSKSECEGLVSRCKSSIDEKNNKAQSDMTRLQSLVDRRDESYSTATSLMTSVSDTRSTLIKQL